MSGKLACPAHCQNASQIPVFTAEALARIGFFYDVEREAKAAIDQQKLKGAQADALRLKERQERTLPKIQQFRLWLDEQAKVVLPKSPLAQAINYAKNHWQALLRFTVPVLIVGA